ncbi:hypothetical protein IFM89_027992 [Coptis chinensis]|uniref:Hexosyltransferase n=1 Tax=Coptis chinensis TaxID=261450 RepID=A0A835LEQ2_9MAGN|nr:hypothetical protein IFM89_027992 [Coptis chinensis]
MDGLNVTEEMLSPHLSDQIALAKSFVVIAKESNNLQFAWELSAQICNSQILLSNVAIKRAPLTATESETAIRDMALLLYQAQQLHYDSTTMIMKLKAKIHWLNASYVPVLKQLQDSDTKNYYFSGSSDGGRTPIKFRNPKYLSMLNHLRFYIPEVFPTLKKVVFLDDDVVVQKDLAPLFSIDLNGNINGAVETCMETFHRYHKYLNYSHPLIRSHFDPDACGWAFGMNIFDLVQWRKRNVTGIYHYWQERNVDRTLWKLGTLPPGLLTFYGLTEPLDPKWHIWGWDTLMSTPK